MINIDKLQTLMWVLFDEIQYEQIAVEQLQQQDAQELKELLKERCV